MFRITLTGNDKYPVQDCQNLLSPIQMQLSLKPKFFSYSFVPFLQSTSNFKHFEKNDDRHRYFILEITDCQRLWLDHSQKKHRFTALFDSRHDKGSQTLVKSA